MSIVVFDFIHHSFVSRFVGVSKAPPVPYCTMNGAGVYIHARGGSAGVYTRTGAKVLAKIIIDQKITWSNHR